MEDNCIFILHIEFCVYGKYSPKLNILVFLFWLFLFIVLFKLVKHIKFSNLKILISPGKKFFAKLETS